MMEYVYEMEGLVLWLMRMQLLHTYLLLLIS